MDYMLAAGLRSVEWGSDVHAPKDDKEKLRRIAAMQQEKGICCCSYGTYFQLGRDPLSELPEYMEAAKILGTNIMRLWCGNRVSSAYTQEEKQSFFAQCREAARMAEAQGMILCMECHNHSFTQLLDGALELMEEVDSPAFRMYWQPNQNHDAAANAEYAAKIAPYTVHIHAFKWVGLNRLPLAEGKEEWQQYLRCFEGDHSVLLEFMPDDQPENLKQEAESLAAILRSVS